jgi:[acyl-carrier-protein] S-malonyltransferase
MTGLAFVFPGQGSQQVGMGTALDAERPRLIAPYLRLAEEASGLPIERYCREGPIEELTRTDVAQPALFSVGLAVAAAAAELGLRGDYLAGHSLGEYTAAVASGALGVEDGMRVVCERGRLMGSIQAERPGAMAAIIGLELEGVEALCRQAQEAGVVGVANLNSPTQIVVSGEEAAVARVIELATAAGARQALRLQVGAAFHSKMMVPVRDALADTLASVAWRDPAVPIASNASGQLVRSADTVRQALVDQIAQPVLWATCVQTLVSSGVTSFLELGPGRVLSGLIRRIDRGVAASAAGSLVELEAFASSS